jgi:uncharacterized protein
MPRQITEKSFFKYVKCPSWVYFDATKPGAPHDPLLSRLVDEKLLPELERAVVSDRPDFVEVTAEDPEEGFRQTLAFMREGRETIYRSVLIDGHWIGSPDILARVEGRSRFGDYYYVAADVKRARDLRDDFKFQGCFYAELLLRVQGAKPAQGYVITPDKTTLAYSIEEFERTYRLTLDEIEKIIAGEKPAHFLTSSCKQSPWFSECRRESESCNDLSILNRVWREEVAALTAAGIRTIDELAGLPLHEVERRAPDLRPDRLDVLHRQAVALKTGTHEVLRPVELPESDIELYFDIESDPLRDLDYLFGVLEVTGGEATYHSFFAGSVSEQEKMWRAFVSFIESHIDAPIYHYGWYEIEVLRAFMARHGVSEIAREAFERNMIDLNVVIRPAVIFPLSFYSLKDIGNYIGFAWRSADASGANSVLWFEKWLETTDDALRKKIFEYNEDDVRATFALQRWLKENAGRY